MIFPVYITNSRLQHERRHGARAGQRKNRRTHLLGVNDTKAEIRAVPLVLA